MEYHNIYDEPKGSVIRGAIGALIGALLGAVVWALVGLLGYMTSIVGFLIAFLASKGYDLMHGRPGKWKLFILIVCVILAVVVGNIGTCAVQIHQVYVEESYSAYMNESLFYELMVPALLEDGDFTSAMVKDTLMGILFAALGCFGLLRQTVPGKKQMSQPVEETLASIAHDDTSVQPDTSDADQSNHSA